MPLNTPDFSSFLLQAKNSGATTIALALAGADLTNAIKQANEFKYRFDYYDVIGKLRGESVFRPMAEGGCSFIAQ